MIKTEYVFPEYYIKRTAFCDDCQVELHFTGTQLLSAPAKNVMICPKCRKRYDIPETEMQGEWKWRTI